MTDLQTELLQSTRGSIVALDSATDVLPRNRGRDVLVTASYIGVDDTGARHDGKNGYCTAIGNDLFAYFESTDSKSRLNFLQVLRGKCRGYAINEVASDYWRQQKLPLEWLEKLDAGPACFVDAAAWEAYLAALGLTAKHLVRTATEGALLGTIIELGAAPDRRQRRHQRRPRLADGAFSAAWVGGRGGAAGAQRRWL